MLYKPLDIYKSQKRKPSPLTVTNSRLPLTVIYHNTANKTETWRSYIDGKQ